MNSFEKKLSEKLRERKKEGIYRKLSIFDFDIDFASNDYLGLSQTEISGEIKNTFNPGSSRLISGTNQKNIDLEAKIADYFHSEEALLFNSGYMANIGVISTLIGRNDVILFDEYCHASMRDAIYLSKCKAYKYKHNDLSDLERLLSKNKTENVFILTEGLFSMTGDFAAIDEIAELGDKYNSYIILDEAHSGGILGEGGTGLISGYNQNRIIAKIITFGKAFGAHGATVLTNKLIKKYLVNFSKTFIYTTSLPDVILNKIDQNLNHFEINKRKNQLAENIAHFIENDTSNSNRESLSPIQIVKFENRKKLKEVEEFILGKNIGVKAIYSPTVPKSEECLRVSIHSFNTRKEILKLCKLLWE